MKKLLLQTVFINSLFFIATNHFAVAQPASTLQNQKIDQIFKTYDRTNGPGCAVGIVQNGKLVFDEGYGMANLEYDIPITSKTVFDIASVSKQFAGLAISTLVLEGKISLDDEVQKYLPDVPKFKHKITVRHLVHHTSGLRDWPQVLNVAGWRWDEVFSFEDIMRMVEKQKDLDFEPGERYSYSNTGYNLMAAIVEKVSGKTFAEWTAANIFEPLQMKSSRFQDDYSRVVKNLAYSYSPDDHGFAKSSGALTAYGSSSLFTTVEDLSKWIINFDKQIALKNPVYTNMLTPGSLNNGNKVSYGYGLGTGQDRNLKTISHTGGWDGYRTIITNYPDEKLSVIILSNSSDFNVGKFSSEVAGIFLKDKFKPEEKTTGSIQDAPTTTLDTAIARKFTGNYLLGPGWVVTLSLEDGKLMTQASGEGKFPTFAKSDSTIWIEAYGASMTFVKEKSGAVNMLRYKNIEAKRITPWKPDPGKFSDFTGVFYSEELETQYAIDFKDGKLQMHHMRIGDFELNPDVSSFEQFGSQIGNISFVRDSNQKVTGLMISGSRVKNLWFSKR